MPNLTATLLYRFPMKLQNWMRVHVCQTPPGEGNGNPLQYFCLGNPTDRGTLQATVHGVAKSQTQLSDLNTATTKRR